MNAGDLRIPIRIERPASDVDSHGQLSIRWTLFMTSRASREIQGGDEAVDNQTVTATQTALFRMRWRTGILPNMRLVDTINNETWNIRSAADPTGKRAELRLMCERVSV